MQHKPNVCGNGNKKAAQKFGGNIKKRNFAIMKTLYIIAGCNGAGKTTASLTMLPEIWQCREFVNADEIARGLSPFNPESMAIEAGQ